jgi:hypothetical protein
LRPSPPYGEANERPAEYVSEVAFGDDSNDLVVRVHDGHAGDLAVGEELRDLLEVSLLAAAIPGLDITSLARSSVTTPGSFVTVIITRPSSKRFRRLMLRPRQWAR